MCAHARASHRRPSRPAAQALEARLFLAAQPVAPAGAAELGNLVQIPPVETTVTDRRLIYNNSVFDFHDSDPTHDLGAVANDKRALLPGEGPAGFENLSSYTKGINGLLVQFFSLGQVPRDLGPDDFEFRMGTGGG